MASNSNESTNKKICVDKSLNAAEAYCLKYDGNIGSKTKKKLLRSRPPEELHIGYWDLDAEGATFAVISCAIKNDFTQSLASLALNISQDKGTTFTEAALALCELRDQGRLFYYSTGDSLSGTPSRIPVTWLPPETLSDDSSGSED